MATHDTTTHPLAFAHMEGGVKTVYVVPNTVEFSMITSGDRIEFDDLGFITAGMVRQYDDLAQLMKEEGFSNVVPEADDEEEAIAAVEGSVDWDSSVVAERGVLAIRVRSARRKS